ncbi:prephenate dehydratase [Desulforhopalus singaporensis]|uniref:prephenate dehydratase n=1 Tax=Desulforhopalus singaporensis TaxID=91360 RepID=A0A1H0S7I9_9BACT|nr:prephenate dehydratase [Desulforhopalus singaporensis]SDP37615.1 prephenate dehydratase [Desulforhopalus singaporensis]
MHEKYRTIAFQGMNGAYSDLACRQAYPEMETVPCDSFSAAFRAVREHKADLAMIPVDNTLAGRVADVHYLMPEGKLHIVGEHFQPIHHCLLGLSGSSVDRLRDVYSHVHALPQCRRFIDANNLTPHVCADTASGAADVKRLKDPTKAAIASELAGNIYGLEILQKNIEDADHNTTRFLVLSRDSYIPEKKKGAQYLTSFLFYVRNIPAALYKALGGFATNNVQMVKLESYVDKHFNVASFYADVEGHISDRSLQLAFQELEFFAKKTVILGTYPAHHFRRLQQEAK